MDVINKLKEWKQTIIFIIVIIGLIAGILYAIYLGNNIVMYVCGGILAIIVAFVVWAITHICVS